MEQAKEPSAKPRAYLIEIAKGALYLLIGAAAVRIVGMWLGNPMSSAVFGAAVVSLLLSRAGLSTEPLSIDRGRKMVGSCLQGAAPILIIALLAVTLGQATVHISTPGTSWIFGTIESIGIAYRDELLLHGLVLLFAKRAGVPPRWAVIYAATASVAAIASLPEATVAGLALTGSAGLWLASLWQIKGDAWFPFAAHFGWVWLATTVLAGEPFDLAIQHHNLPYGASASGWMAWTAAACFLGFGIRLWPRLDQQWETWPA